MTKDLLKKQNRHSELNDIIEDEKAELLRKGGLKKGGNKQSCGFHRIEIKDLAVKSGQTVILENMNLSIYCGKLTVLIGKNGAGKSTLMKCILGERNYQGSITFRDTKNNTVSRLKVGYVPQNLEMDQNAPVSVYDLVAAYTSRLPVFIVKNKRLYERIKSRLEIFEAGDLIDKRVCDLSGGELQRVLLTIACTPIPNLLLLDEPVSGIDRNGRELFYKILDEIKRSCDLSIILVSHDLDLTARYADNVVLVDKTIVKSGSAAEVMNSPEFAEIFRNRI